MRGTTLATGVKLGVVASRFNSFIVDRLIEGALEAVDSLGGDREAVTVIRCPGAFEIPQVTAQLLKPGKFDAVVCLGCVIRGQTPHFDAVAGEAVKGVGQLALQSDIPITMGIITADTLEQAIDRAGAKAGNKGWDATLAALELVSLFSQLKSPRSKR